MPVTVRDILTIDRFDKLELIAGAGGLSNEIVKVGILDFEFTKLGSKQSSEEHWWKKNEFVLSTFLYAKDNPALLPEAVKKLHACQTGGLAIKNVFFLEIPREVIRYADQNDYPLFVFTDHSLFFEDIIIKVHDLIQSSASVNQAEKTLYALIHGGHDKSAVKKIAIEINSHFKNYLQAIYFSSLNNSASQKLPVYLARAGQAGRIPVNSSIVKYEDGFFYIATADNPNAINVDGILKNLTANLGISMDNFQIGISDALFYLTNFRKILLQSWYATLYCKITGERSCFYRDTGAYQLLFSSFGEEWAEDFYNSLIAPLSEYDANNQTSLLDVAVKLEECRGNIREMSLRLNAHENTVRYKIAKIYKILDRKADDSSLAEHLSLAVKLHKLKSSAISRSLPPCPPLSSI